MPRYAIVSSPRAFAIPAPGEFDAFYRATGANLGNLAFVDAAWRIVGGEKARVGFDFAPDRLSERFDAVIIPAANWINPNVDLSDLVARIARLRIPVVTIGLGAQAPLEGPAPNWPGAARELAVSLAAHAPASISVRGAFTAQTLRSLGVDNMRVTGCPSLYAPRAPLPDQTRRKLHSRKVLLHGTRYSAAHAPFFREASFDRDLMRFAYRANIDIAFQSEPEEISLLLTGRTGADSVRQARQLKAVYDARFWPLLRRYIRRRGQAHLSADDWSTSLRAYQFVFGSRLHGTIMALNSGVVAVIAPQDARTRELAEFAQIPVANDKFSSFSIDTLRRAYSTADLEPFRAARRRGLAEMKVFFQENNVAVDPDWPNEALF